jgi:excisionase family DNA binding protein
MSTTIKNDRLSLMDLPALAERLGVNQRYVRRLVAERRVPFIKFGHLLRFDPSEIEAWLGTARVPTERNAQPTTPDQASWRDDRSGHTSRRPSPASS